MTQHTAGEVNNVEKVLYTIIGSNNLTIRAILSQYMSPDGARYQVLLLHSRCGKVLLLTMQQVAIESTCLVELETNGRSRACQNVRGQDI